MRLIERFLKRYTLRESYIPTTGLVLDGGAVRVVSEGEAREFWRKRLRG